MVNVGVEAVHHTQVEAVSVQNVAAQGGVGAGFVVVGRVVGVLLWGSVRWCWLLFWLAGGRLRSWGWLIVLPEIIIIFVIIPKVIITFIIIPKVVTMFIILKIVLLILSDRNFFINDLNLFFFLFRFNNNFRFRLNFRLRSRLRWCDGLFLIFVPPVFPGVCLHSKQSY